MTRLSPYLPIITLNINTLELHSLIKWYRLHEWIKKRLDDIQETHITSWPQIDNEALKKYSTQMKIKRKQG
jgi:hypothetical protein